MNLTTFIRAKKYIYYSSVNHNMSYWVNIDKPTTSYKLHRIDCRYCKPVETPNKGLRKIKIDGGWLPFDSKKDAKKYRIFNHSNLHWEPCKICNP